MNPFDQYRSYFGQQMMNLMKNPSSITSSPGYQAGAAGVEASMASQGYGGSGNMMSALQKYAGTTFWNQIQTLAGYAGSGAAPGAGAGVAVQGMNEGVNTQMAGLASMNAGAALANPMGGY
jgi:hypothetical protein